jgi:hypothetical protein
MRARFAMLGLAGLLGFGLLSDAAAQGFGGREELANARTSIRIVPEGGGAGFGAGSATGENQVGRRTFRIVRVTPLAGQNPLNQESPALNFDGETFDTAQALQDAAEGNDGNAGNIDGNDQCTGQSINSAVENFGGTDFAFAGIALDSNTGDCFLRNDGEGPTLIYQFPGSGGGGNDDNQLDIFPDVLVGEFVLLNPPPNAGSGVNVAFGAFTFTLQAINGAVFDISFNVVKISGDLVGGVVQNPAFRLTVISIVQTN